MTRILQAEDVSPGLDAKYAEAGDFILCHRKGFAAWCIRQGERLHFKPGSRWSHAAFCEDDMFVIEALTHGVRRTPLAAYRNVEYTLVKTHMDPKDAEQAIAYARHLLYEKYGWLEILGVALRFLTPGRWGLYFGSSRTTICSGLVANALTRGDAIFDVEPSTMTPAELASYHNVPVRPPKVLA